MKEAEENGSILYRKQIVFSRFEDNGKKSNLVENILERLHIN